MIVLDELALDEEELFAEAFPLDEFEFALAEDELLAEDVEVNMVEPEFVPGDDCIDSIDTSEEEDDEDALELPVPLEACAELDADEELEAKE